jgi:hypothetical protein
MKPIYLPFALRNFETLNLLILLSNLEQNYRSLDGRRTGHDIIYFRSLEGGGSLA